MLSFFQKKRYLIDLLNGFVDIHNHILPGIDDGAKTVEESLALIRGFSDFGINNFVCTPHIMHNYYNNTPETIQASFSLLKKEMANQGLHDVSIDMAAEHMIDDNFEHILSQDRIMPLRKYHMLIEMSFLQPSINFNQAIRQIISKNYFPILAHPERYMFLQNNLPKYRSYKEKGILFQLNLLSLGDYYSKRVTATAGMLLENDLIDFVGTDVHTMRQLDSLKNTAISNRTVKKLYPLINGTIEQFY
ncbi:MAG: CpsB/CapC family capsule biosynthesis tyrosine phosphatase [Bacteroidota bacterium]